MQVATPRSCNVAWDAMGTTCRVALVGPDADQAAAWARAELARLEGLWSRFLPDSDVQRLNGAGGKPVAVATETISLVAEALTWWHATEGRFDPTVLDAVVAAGYDRDLRTGHGPIRAGEPTPGAARILIDAGAGTITLPAGVRIDLGGIGKGRAVDLLVDGLAHLPGGLVDLGGDLRVWGRSSDEEPGWPIAVEDLRDGSTTAVLGLAEGAVATSSVLRRQWSDGVRRAHHLIDPATGRPARGELVTVTVLAGSAAAAEVIAKHALLSGSIAGATAVVGRHGTPALLVPAAGPPVPVGGFEDVCWVGPGGSS
jgi:FAD:protein FMN transferase